MAHPALQDPGEPGTRLRRLKAGVYTLYGLVALSVGTDYFSHVGEREVFPIELVEWVQRLTVAVWVIVSVMVIVCIKTSGNWSKAYRTTAWKVALAWLAAPFAWFSIVAFLILLDGLGS